jgi:6-pyruvoyltetrahydropterin/6-carboxytetrahydropterin synthase
MITAERYHDISCGHRVYGHENACAGLHGHNYRVTFTLGSIAGDLDTIGRVIDFSIIKSKLCMWLEDNWDHKFLLWEKDPLYGRMSLLLREGYPGDPTDPLTQSLIGVPFNPTAENMANHLMYIIGPQQLLGTGAGLQSVRVEETRKCSATVTKF